MDFTPTSYSAASVDVARCDSAVAKAWSRSAKMSSMCSMPTESRIVSGQYTSAFLLLR